MSFISFIAFKMASAVNMCCIRAVPNYTFTRIIANNCMFQGVAKFSRSASSICVKKTQANVLAQISFGGMSPASSGLWSALPSIIGDMNTRRGSRPLGFGYAMSYSTQKPSLTEEIMNAKLPPPPPPPESPLGKEEPKEQQKKDSWFSGKNAWKFGLASLAAVGVMMCGNILILWGTTLIRLLSLIFIRSRH